MAALDLKGLWETFVVGRWECEATAAGILPSPPALNRKGNEARLDRVLRRDCRRLAWCNLCKRHNSKGGDGGVVEVIKNFLCGTVSISVVGCQRANGRPAIAREPKTFGR